MLYENNLKFLVQLKSLYNKYSRYLPWVSLLWGVISGFLLTRDYTKTIQLTIFTFAFLFFIVTMSTWYSYITKISNLNINSLKKIQRSLQKRKDFLEFIGSTATQFFVQYIFMFCIPFMYFKGEWIWFVFLICFAIMTVWDPFWSKLFRISFFRLLLRLLAFCMAFSFLYAVLFPKYLDYFYIWFSVICFIIMIPWNAFFIRRRLKISELISTLILTVSIVFHSFLSNDLKFPVLSIWMENPQFSFENPKKEGFSVIKNNIVKRKALMQKLKEGKSLCSIAPIIAPIGIQYQIMQEWYVDGQYVEKIILPSISGSKNTDKYKTYSCKSSFPNLKNAKEINCKTYLKNGIYIGQESLSIRAD